MWHLAEIAKEESDLPNDFSERGIGFQAFGFAVVGLSSVALLQIGSGSDCWLYKSFQAAVTQLHWAFLVPLAALFDWGRTMFETRKAIREAALQRQIEKAVDKKVKEALENERKRIRQHLENCNLPEDVEKKIFVQGP